MGSLHTSPTSPPPLPHLNRLLNIDARKAFLRCAQISATSINICCVFTAIHPVSNRTISEEGSVSRASTLDKALATKKKVCCMCICSYQHNLCVIVPRQGKLCEPPSTLFACCCRLSLTHCLLLRWEFCSSSARTQSAFLKHMFFCLMFSGIDFLVACIAWQPSNGLSILYTKANSCFHGEVQADKVKV